MLGSTRSKTLQALGLTVLMFGCANDGTSISPSAPTPIPSPAPALPDPTADSVLSGVVTEVTETGRTPLAGIAVHLETCGKVNCPRPFIAAHDVKTGADGSYRVVGVYNGDLNFFWVRNEVYDVVNPMAPGTCPDRCDRVVTVNGDTRLDVDVVRR
jgi:hypothetical protein